MAAANLDPLILGTENNATLPTSLKGISDVYGGDLGNPMLRVVSRAGSAIVGWAGDSSVIGDGATDVGAPGTPFGAVVIAGGATQEDVFQAQPAGMRAAAADPNKTAAQFMHISGGLALDVIRGKTRFSTARSVLFPAGQLSLQVFDPDVTADSVIVATFQSDTGNAALRYIQRAPGVGFVAEITHRLQEPAELGYLLFERGGSR